MAILMVLEAKGATEDDYRRVNEHMGIRGEEDAPEGLVSHVAGRTDDGIVAVDVWESQAQLDRFFAERAGAAFASIGLDPGPPRILPVHNLIAQGAGTDAGVLVLIDLPGLTAATYDALIGQMEAHGADGSNHPAVSHVAAATDDGLYVADVWASPEAFGAFAESQIRPIAADHDLPPFEPRFVPVVQRLRGAAARR